MRGQIDGFIAQGEPVMDTNTGRDLQNSLSDLESSVQQAQQKGMKVHYLRDVQSKTDDLASQISDAQSHGLISDSATSALTSELQTFSGAFGNGGGNN
jgi:hypothetical protein